MLWLVTVVDKRSGDVASWRWWEFRCLHLTDKELLWNPLWKSYTADSIVMPEFTRDCHLRTTGATHQPCRSLSQAPVCQPRTLYLSLSNNSPSGCLNSHCFAGERTGRCVNLSKPKVNSKPGDWGEFCLHSRVLPTQLSDAESFWKE